MPAAPVESRITREVLGLVGGPKITPVVGKVFSTTTLVDLSFFAGGLTLALGLSLGLDLEAAGGLVGGDG